MNYRLTIILVSAFTLLSYSSIQDDSRDEWEIFFTETNNFLSENVDRDGGVDYMGILQSPEDLNSLVKKIGSIDITHADKQQKIAFYINAYNLLVIDKLIKKGIPKSPLDDNNFFSSEDILVHGSPMSLDELEKQVLFKLEPDPRFHFVLVCGAKGCPPLKNVAYTPENLEAMLEARTSWAINYPLFTRTDRVGKVIYLSQIFKWYEQDFKTKSGQLVDYLNTYLTKPISSDYEIVFYEYNWTINSQSNESK